MPKVKNKARQVEVGTSQTWGWYLHIVPVSTFRHNQEYKLIPALKGGARPERVDGDPAGGLTNLAETDSESEIDPNVFITAATKKLKEEDMPNQPTSQNVQIIGSEDNDSKHKPDSLFSDIADDNSERQSASDISDKRLQEAWQTYNKLARSHRQKLLQYKHSKSLIASLRRENRRLLREAKVHAAKFDDARAEISAQKTEIKHEESQH